MSLDPKIRGLFPKRIPVAPSVHVHTRTKIVCGERWLIEYTVEEDERVRAFLLVPGKMQKANFAVLALHQHNGEFDVGKSEPAGLRGDPDMAYGLELCERGFVVLCPDHAGFEERQQKELSINYPLKGKAYEQFLFVDNLLHGRSLASKYLYDLVQAVDALSTFDFIGKHKFGVIGHSLGGQEALWLTAWDPRIKVGFSSCGFSTLREIQRRSIPHNLALCLPGLLAQGDIDDIVSSIAPRSFGMSHGINDGSFPLSGVREIHRRAEKVFPENSLLKVLFRGGHAFPLRIRQKAYAFIQEQLMST